MKARVKHDSRWAVVTACGGAEFVRGEWRAVAEGREEEARANPFLEIGGVFVGQPDELEKMLDALPQTAHSAPEIEAAPASITIDTSDGVQPAEASAAGRVLQQSPKKPVKKGKK